MLTLLALYTGESVAVAAALRYPLDEWEHLPLWLCGIDLALGAALTLLTNGPASPFFVLFLFVLVSAAFRWGLRETLATGAIAIAARSGAGGPAQSRHLFLPAASTPTISLPEFRISRPPRCCSGISPRRAGSIARNSQR